MKNQKVANILYRIADLLEMNGVDYRTKAYRKAGHTVEFLSKDIKEVKEEGKLQELPGIGKSIARKIEEIIDTDSLEYYENLKKEFPVDFEALLAVEGLGPKTIKLLYEELDVKDLDDLERQAKRHRIRRLKGMGDKSERRILQSIEFARKGTGRRLLGHILPVALTIKNELKKFERVNQVEIAGSIRRRKETVGDIDILVTSNKPEEVMDFFTTRNVVDDIIVKGSSKSTVRLKIGIECDLRVFNEESFGSALLYFTGSKETNIEMRRIAIKNDLKLNEYGIFRSEKQIAGRTEEDVFDELGMAYIEPELRENRGEIEAAFKGRLPNLIPYDQLKGDLQIHTTWSDGSANIEDMAKAACKLGYEYIGVTDHSGSLRIAGGMDEKQIRKQMEEIDNVNEKVEEITVFKGVEVNIKSNGKLDLEDQLLKDLNLVIAAVHSGFREGKETMTWRITSAMENPNVDIIAHPTGRKIQERKAYDLDFERVFEVARETDTYLEVNSQPNRLDLSDINIKRALDAGCKLVINTDAHNLEQLKYIELGIATARRGWGREIDIINTLPMKKLDRLLT